MKKMDDGDKQRLVKNEAGKNHAGDKKPFVFHALRETTGRVVSFPVSRLTS